MWPESSDQMMSCSGAVERTEQRDERQHPLSALSEGTSFVRMKNFLFKQHFPASRPHMYLKIQKILKCKVFFGKKDQIKTVVWK